MAGKVQIKQQRQDIDYSQYPAFVVSGAGGENRTLMGASPGGF